MLCFILLAVIVTGVFACPDGWFGAGCQYMCHCTGENCWPNGECRDNATCERGWFGPLCQYEDIARNNTTVISVPTLRPELALDDNSETCTGNITVLSLTWDESIIFTWLRFILKNPEHSSAFRLDFLNRKLTMPCRQQRVFQVSFVTFDLYCTLDTPVQQVNAYFDTAEEVCSLYISGGRNVALKQTAKHSYLHGKANTSASWDLTVDGKRNCSKYPLRYKAQWSVDFQHPMHVSRYVFYVFYENLTLIIETSSWYNQSLLNYADFFRSRGEGVHRILPIGNISLPVSRVTITDRKFTFDYLCEVEIFAETVCPEGTYGFDCSETCDCPVKCETSYNSSLGCPQCPVGFQGYLCDKPAIARLGSSYSLWTDFVSFIVTGCLSLAIITLLVILVCLCCRQSQSGRRTSLEQCRDVQRRNQYTTAPQSHCFDQTSEERPKYLNLSDITESTMKTKKERCSDGYLQPQVILQFKRCDSVQPSPVKGQAFKLNKIKEDKPDDEEDCLYEEISV